MAINQVEIKDFMVFRGEFACDFCKGVNVIIGGNATGKTTLLKSMYWGCEFSRNSVWGENRNLIIGANEANHNPFLPYFYFTTNTLMEKIENFDARLKFSWGETEGIQPALEASISKDLSSIQLHDTGETQSIPLGMWCDLKIHSIFIPEKDILSHSKGLLALETKFSLPFDKTYMDILVNAELPTSPDITPNALKLLDKIKYAIGGEVHYKNDTFYIGERPFSLEASGYRKFGLLWKLLRNGLLEKNSILFWDEPENSINPELIPLLVEILLELQHGGVQIFLATHSEMLVNYFDVLRNEDNEVMFYSLYKDGEQIKADKSERFDLLTPNNLKSEPVKLYEKEIERWLGNE